MMQNRGITELLQRDFISSAWAAMVHPDRSAEEIDIPLGPETLAFIVPQLEKLAEAVQNTIHRQEFPCALGGDHVMGVGTFSAAADALGAKENFGLIWIDAHMDSHTPETSPSQAYHGMPVASLLGYGDPQLANLVSAGRKVRPEHLILIGIRSYEPQEKALLDKLGVKIFYCEQVKTLGFNNIIQESLAYLEERVPYFGVSIDLDAFDPVFAPGVGSPEPNGLIPTDVLPYLNLIRNSPSFAALEVTEFNPERDQKEMTAQLIEQILKQILPR
jgi:arginase